MTECAIVLKQDAGAALHNIYEKEVDVIFMDPPYEQGQEERILGLLSGMKYVTEDTLIVVEASLGTDFSYLEELGFGVEKEKRYKTNKHMFIKRK